MRWRWLVVVVVVAWCAILLLLKFFPFPVPKGAVVEVSSQKEYENYLQQQAESSYKKDYYSRLIPVYQKMVKVAPESLEAKKKLARAYIGAEQFAEARRLLEEIVQSGRADAEIRQWLERLN
ncbi:MAG: tetratricopeptide repeat protein [Deltaproteobacteria bacterium]|nr:tetratricopeptide repeat protein [Deltaproteobacteria bacterium]